MPSGPQAAIDRATSPDSLFTSLDPPETNSRSADPAVSIGDETVPPSWHLPPNDPEVYRDNPLYDESGESLFRHSGWKADRKRVYESLLRTGRSASRIQAFCKCGRDSYVFESQDRPGEYSIGGSACHDRFCLPCARDRSRIIAQNVLEQIGRSQARFLTLTLKSTNQPLSDLLARLTKSFTKLRTTKLWKNKVTGGVAFVEVTWSSRSDSWHPHLHCLIQGRYLPNKELSKLWRKITGDSSIIDIRFATDNAHVTHYITKYASKPLDHSVAQQVEQLDETILALQGKRLCLTFGTWRGVCLTKRIDDGVWIQIGSLRELIQRAYTFDSEATSILHALQVRFAQDPRGPPCTNAPAAGTGTSKQYTLSFNADIRIRPGASTDPS